jgi:hypothetical protein
MKSSIVFVVGHEADGGRDVVDHLVREGEVRARDARWSLCSTSDGYCGNWVR